MTMKHFQIMLSCQEGSYFIPEDYIAAFFSTVIIIAAPIKCGIDGYNSHGILGCAGNLSWLCVKQNK